ncbi:MAG TPA: twin-arginine translocase subunit TatC, partial [Acidimicrobiales bacterium]
MTRRGKERKPRARSVEDRMTLAQHLGELRERIVKCVLAIFVGMIVVLVFYDTVLDWLREPYTQICAEHVEYGCSGDFLLTDPLDGFATRMRVSGYGGLFLAMPVVLWQLWRFITPGLHPKEKRYAIPFLLSSIVLFALGAAIAYWTLPKALEFLVSFSGGGFAANFNAGRYIRLLTLMMLAFGAGFLFPILLMFLQLVGVLTPRRLLEWWRTALVVIAIAAAVITPSGDPISLTVLSVPMYLFYEIAILYGRLWQRRKRKAGASAGAVT